MAKRPSSSRLAATTDLTSFLASERRRLFDGASPQRREQLRAAERQHEIFQAWNEVCGGTREGSHVTGLHFVPERDELIVYVDGASWVQELTMMREIIRGRMEMRGGRVSRLVFKASRTPRERASARVASAPSRKGPTAPAPREALNERERASVEGAVAAIDDPKLKEALKKAMTISLEVKKAKEHREKA